MTAPGAAWASRQCGVAAHDRVPAMAPASGGRVSSFPPAPGHEVVERADAAVLEVVLVAAEQHRRAALLVDRHEPGHLLGLANCSR